jgi:hypothetical protein
MSNISYHVNDPNYKSVWFLYNLQFKEIVTIDTSSKRDIIQFERIYEGEYPIGIRISRSITVNANVDLSTTGTTATTGTTGEIETTGTTGIKPFPKVHIIITGQTVTNELPFVIQFATTIDVGSFVSEIQLWATSIDAMAEVVEASHLNEIVGSTIVQYWEIHIYPGQICELDGIYTLLLQTNFTSPFNVTKDIILDSQDFCGDIITSPVEAIVKIFEDPQRNISNSEFHFNDVAYFQVRSNQFLLNFRYIYLIF